MKDKLTIAAFFALYGIIVLALAFSIPVLGSWAAH
jgi:hypothetical protein